MDFDDWELTAEELDFLEQDALRQIAQRNSSVASTSSCTTSTSSSSQPKSQCRQPSQERSLSQQLPHLISGAPFDLSPSKPSARTSQNQIDTSSPKSRRLPASVAPKLAHDSANGCPKLSVKFFLHASGNVAAKFPYDQVLVHAFRKIPKASWNARERIWMFPITSLQSVEKVITEISGFIVEVENLDPLVRRAIAVASAAPDLRDRYDSIPDFLEAKLLPFQRDGVRFMLQHGGRALLADEMGLGKTLQAIAVTACVRESWPVLVLCPSSLRLHWATMIHQWLHIPPSDIVVRALTHMHPFSLPVGISFSVLSFSHERLSHILARSICSAYWSGSQLSHIKDGAYSLLTKEHVVELDFQVVLSQWCGSNKCGFSIVSSNKGLVQLDGVFNIVSYDSVPKLQSALLSSEFQIVVADESHYLKNAQAKRTITALPVLQKAQYSILLSGTPALSRPIELFKQLEALRPNVYKNVHEYGNRYCKGGVFGVYQGSSNHEELHNLMKATVMIRRLKKDVLTELPVKRRQQVFLELAEKDMRQINALFREMQVLKAKIKNCNSEEDYNSLKLTEKNLINKIYIESAEAKIPAVLDYLGTVIEAGCKFLIFAHHQPMVEAIHQFLQKKKVGCIRIDGSTPASSRLAMVQDFQEKDSIKAAVLSIRAAGVGLTLTAASTVIFAELSWTPGDLIQAEDRAHRIGQVSSVNVYYLLANDTVDDIIWDVVQSKLENLGQVLDGQENMLEVSHSQPRSSPGKQQTLDAFMKRENVEARSSPAKQKTLDAFMKRCNNSEDTNSQPKVKLFRQEK